MLLRPSPRRIAKIFTKMMTTQTHTPRLMLLDPNKYPATGLKKHPNLPPRENFWLLTPYILMEISSDEDMDDLMLPTLDQMTPLVNRLIRYFKSFDTFISKLENIGYLNPNKGSRLPSLHLLRCLSHAGNHDLLVHTYHHLVKFHAFIPNTFASNLYMDSLFTTGQTQFAFSVFKQIKSPNFFTFDIALFHVSHLNDIANISHVLTHMLRMSYYPCDDNFNKLLYSLCEINTMPQVYQLLSLMVVKLGIEMDVSVWTLLVTKFIELEILNEMNAMLSDGFVLDDKGSCVAHIHAVCDEVRNVAASGVFHIPDCDYQACHI